MPPFLLFLFVCYFCLLVVFVSLFATEMAMILFIWLWGYVDNDDDDNDDDDNGDDDDNEDNDNDDND